MNLLEINNTIKMKEDQIAELSKQIEELSKDRDILANQEHRYRIGDRVHLTKSYNDDHYREKWPGWRHALHFMHPANIATIKDIECYHGTVTYFIKFDNQICYIGCTGEEYVEDSLWRFTEDKLEPVSQDALSVTISYEDGTSTHRDVYSSRPDILKALMLLKNVGLIEKYDIQPKLKSDVKSENLE